MNQVKRVWLGLGGNLADPIGQIVDARLKLIQLECVSAWQCSSMYLSSPVGYSDQPDFINCVLSLDVDIGAKQLFAQIQLIEIDIGRIRFADNQNAPRKIDIDLLLFDDEVLNTPELIVPHPRMTQRLFVLEPLRELGVEIERDESTDFTQQIIYRLSL